MRSGKSSLAYQRLLDWGGGVFITFRGVPAHFKKRPWTVNDDDKDLPHLDYFLRNDPLLQIRVTHGRLVEVIAAIRGRERFNVVFDDAYQLVTQDRRTRADATIDLDTYLSECGQRGCCAILTTHRAKLQLSTFIQENAALYWVGPARKPRTIADLYELSELPMNKDEFYHAVYRNPVRTAFALKG